MIITNPEYVLIKTKIDEFNAELTRLSENNAEKLQYDAHIYVERHFDEIINAINIRKEFLHCSIDQKSIEIKQKMEEQERELKEKIAKCNEVLTLGTSFYESDPQVAIHMWQAIDKITFKKEAPHLSVAFPLKLKDIVNEHGIVSSLNPSTSLSNRSDRASLILSQPKDTKLRALRVMTFVGASMNEIMEGKNIIKNNFNGPTAVALNEVDGCLYVCDSGNSRIRRITPSGDITKFAHTSAKDITYDKNENCFYVVRDCAIKRVSFTGRITTLAGGSDAGHKDGKGGKAMFNYPGGITFDSDNNDIYVTDSNYVIRKITTEGITTTVAGIPRTAGYVDGDAHLAQFKYISCISIHPHSHDLIICDNGNNKVRKLSCDGQVSTICSIPSPSSVAVLNDGSIIVAGDYKIYRVSFTEESNVSEVEVFAGTGISGDKDGMPKESQFEIIRGGMAVNTKTNTCFMADGRNNKIRAIQFG